MDAIGKSFLVFDIETYPDKQLVEAVHGKNLDHFRNELLSRFRSSFLPTIFHIPIAISILRVGADLVSPSVEVRTATVEREYELLQFFWTNSNELAGNQGRNLPNGLLVSFNGSDFDLRVLEQRALKYGLSGNTVFRNPDSHFDIPVFLSNFQAGRKRGLSLETLSKLVGLAGKSLLRGEEVERTYDSGNLNQIAQYCLLDVIQTYLVFLRCQVFLGLPRDRYDQAIYALSSLVATSRDPSVIACRDHLQPLVQSLQGVALR